MSQPPLFDLTPFKGPPDNLRRARELFALVEDLGTEVRDVPDWYWSRRITRAMDLAMGLQADTDTLEAIYLLGDSEARSMLGATHLATEATRHTRDLVERLTGVTP